MSKNDEFEFDYRKPFAGMNYCRGDFMKRGGLAARCRSIFVETCDKEKDVPLYTLSPDDSRGIPSLYKLYLQSSDETLFAYHAFGDYKIFEYLLESNWFMGGHPDIPHQLFNGIHEWRQHKADRLIALANKGLESALVSGNMTAIKYVKSKSRDQIVKELRMGGEIKVASTSSKKKSKEDDSILAGVHKLRGLINAKKE